MKEPLTDELLQELLDAPDPKTFADSHRIKERSLSGYLQQLLDEKGLERAEVVRKAGLNETFGYQIFMGQRGASRNKVLQLVFAMGLSLKEADRLLQAAGANELYCKSRRDAIIIFCLDRGYGLQKTDEELYRFGEDTIC
ncbi:XRE family transcriptional regulator [Gordonibacter massiliensis (ex Traore et al. 2017)]|uniref:XRE family transcriptional regulator n=1 Tax=Gordonibacter massiliensis (ex Traore et al. 2017) TaxID=1841863 RepID=UPI001C8C3AC8|nr:XRE family transcriptional regulator [Gordonibacter massiliensis (ex Traore et al. 2017)]